MRTKLRWLFAFAGAALLLGACGLSDPSQSTFEPAGPVAQQQKDLFLGVFWVAVAVFILVEGGIVLIMVRYRRRKGQETMPAQTHGNTRLEVGWTILPTLVLAGVMVPTVGLLWDLARDPGPDALRVTVEGHQWWWNFVYTGEDMLVDYADQPITVPDVMVIPEDTDVWLTLESVGGSAKDANGVPDFAVVHSFWIPELAGGQDVVPNRTNHLLLRGSEPGTYEGQCKEFCGLQHTLMKTRVVVLTAAEWDAWVEHQKQPAAQPTDAAAIRGLRIFKEGPAEGAPACISCHSIGRIADGPPNIAPNLTHFADPTHECFTGCTWEADDLDSLRAWLRDPDAARMGSKMPDYGLTEGQIDDLVALLTILE